MQVFATAATCSVYKQAQQPECAIFTFSRHHPSEILKHKRVESRVEGALAAHHDIFFFATRCAVLRLSSSFAPFSPLVLTVCSQARAGGEACGAVGTKQRLTSSADATDRGGNDRERGGGSEGGDVPI